jgi:hypothetical protein
MINILSSFELLSSRAYSWKLKLDQVTLSPQCEVSDNHCSVPKAFDIDNFRKDLERITKIMLFHTSHQFSDMIKNLVKNDFYSLWFLFFELLLQKSTPLLIPGYQINLANELIKRSVIIGSSSSSIISSRRNSG